MDYLDGVEWRLTATPAGACRHPDELPADARWQSAQVPGTVVSSIDSVADLQPDSLDWWLLASATAPEGIATTLTFGGIATRATIWIGGVESARTRSMFVPVSIDLEAGSGPVHIAVRIESMDAHLKKRRPRGRWRSSLVAQQGLRHERTTLLGRAPVYGPLPPVVGLWRPVELRERPTVRNIRMHAAARGADGTVRVRADLGAPAESVVVRIGAERISIPSHTDRIDASVVVPDVALWWPHTHGEPTLYPWELEVDGSVVGSGTLGFRSAHLDRTDRSVTLTVNGIRTFARGGCWVPPDPTRMWVDADRMRCELERIRDAGHNMVRVVGTLVYEQREFWSLCAELGILVWQDVMVATFDPPEDEDFVEAFEQELAELTGLVGGNPALAVVSGGSETQQQPTMLGVPADGQCMSLLEKLIPEFLESELPGTPYVTSSPSSTTGELHTHVGDGIAHYFGVGGYLRPLSDVRTARVRFAAECLAFSIPPERRSVEKMFGSATVAGHHPDWKAAVPRDRGSSWDFEDVRDHYVREIFGVDPHLVRRDDAELYLDYGRAAVCEAVSSSYMHWRRTDSECSGALVLTLRDLVPGAGWGLIDSAGIPKAPWYSLARLSGAVAIFLVDDGLDGLTVELVVDTAEPVHGTLRVTLHGATGAAGEPYECPVELGAHSSQRISVDRVLGSFTDAGHAYRFGSQTYAAVSVDLVDSSGITLAQAVHLVGARHARQNGIGLEAHAEPVDDGVWSLTVSTRWAAQYVCIDVDGLEVSDSWFHLAPGSRRVLTVTGDKAQVKGHVRALNSVERAQIS